MKYFLNFSGFSSDEKKKNCPPGEFYKFRFLTAEYEKTFYFIVINAGYYNFNLL